MDLKRLNRIVYLILGIGLVVLATLWTLSLHRTPKGAGRESSFIPLPLGSVLPEGWLKRQLRIQAEGLTGHLDEFWPDLRDSGWTGGPGEGWERGPYWMDGLVPLAYLLDDARLIGKVRGFMDYNLDHQKEDGWMGPEQSPPSLKGYSFPFRDPWPAFVFLKALAQYQEASGDPRVLPAMLRFLQNLDFQFSRRALFSWAHFRSTELVWVLDWMSKRSRDPVLASLADKAKTQGYDWGRHFADLPVRERSRGWTYEGHVVNNAMGLKGAGGHKASLRALQTLDLYHGQASGIFSGDECFAGLMPSQGTELCAVVEEMWSLENLGARYQEAAFFDRLEKIAYNALPATLKKDGWAHQYVQQANQPVVKISGDRVYTTNDPDANIFGLEPNYGCCTANMHQGWPKFVSHLWMGTPDGGLAAVAWGPCRVLTRIGDTPVEAEVVTDYPFSSRVEIRIRAAHPVAFPLWLRIPAWAEGASLSEASDKKRVKAGSFHKISRTWRESQTLVLDLPMRIRSERRYNKAASISRGPLVYSLKIKERWSYLRGEEPHADWEVFPESPWNYALQIAEKEPDLGLSLEEAREMPANPFSPEGTPLVLKGKARRLPAWSYEHSTAAPPPPSPVRSFEPLEDVELIPYGATSLRITEFPVLP